MSSFKSCLSAEVSGTYEKKEDDRFGFLILINLLIHSSETSITKYLQKFQLDDF